MRAKIAHQALALVQVGRRAFIVVVADVADETDRRLVERQQAALHRRDRHAGTRVRVHDAGDFLARAMDAAMDHVARLVDVVVGVGLPHDVAVEVDLHQARGGDLLVRQPVEVDQQ